MNRIIARRTLLAMLVALAFFAGMLNATSSNADESAWHNMLPKTMRHACRYEDSVNCYWNAGSRNNHRGHSFIVRQFPKAMTPNGLQKRATICVMYVNKADAKKWDYCD